MYVHMPSLESVVEACWNLLVGVVKEESIPQQCLDTLIKIPLVYTYKPTIYICLHKM